MRYLLFLLVAFSLFACNSDSSTTSTSTDQSGIDAELPKAQFVKQTVDPPILDAQLPLQEHRVNAEQGGHLSLASGTEIDIPASAFVYPNGEAVTGYVTISVREIRTTAEVILSGIPMQDWDDETQQYQNFSTAGMIEIRGVDENQQTVEIAPEQSLDVHFASTEEGTYDFWYFDEDKGDWESQGSNTGEAFPPVSEEMTAASDLPAQPTPPREYDPEAIRVTFAGMNLADFPELNDPDNVALQYAGKAGGEDDPEANEWIFATNWYSAKLTRGNRAGVYRLDLENDDKEFTTQVQATLLPAAYESALNEYRRELAAFEAAVQNMEQSRQRNALIRRSMQINRFGIYNYDVYARWEEPVFANADFQSPKQKDWNDVEQIYLITDNGRVAVSYPKGDWARFNFDRNRKNILLAITSAAEIIVLSPEDFTNQSANLAGSTRQQEWECVLGADAFVMDDPASLQKVIDTHFAG